MKMKLLSLLVCIIGLCGSQAAMAKDTNEVRLIRNATLKIDYDGNTILLDPMLGEKGTLMSALGVNLNPRVHLTMPIREILDGVDFVMLTHTHVDHYDRTAKDSIPKDMMFYVQPADLDSVAVKDRFEKTQAIVDSAKINNLTIIRVEGSHGKGELGKMMGESSGYIIKAPEEPTLYIMGDCMWDESTKAAVAKYHPDYIVVNSGGAIFPPLSKKDGPIIPDEKEVMKMLLETPPDVKLICVHMDAVDHCQTTRDILRNEAIFNKIDMKRLIIPEDGETIKL